MSRSSIKPSGSPTIEDPPNDELAAGAEQGSYHETIRESTEPVRPGSGGGESGSYGPSRSSRTVLNYPIDADLFSSTPTQPEFAPDAEDGPEDIEYQEPPPENLIHPPDFKPFFTLIQDPETGEYQHPTVHYIFSDDDPEILTSAVLDTLDRNELDFHADKPFDDVEDRYVILDIAADGKSVVSAVSLSEEWQNLQASVSQAPSWGEENGEGHRGLMLKISGRHKGKTEAAKDGKGGNVEELVKRYGEGLDRLNEMLGRG